SQSAQQYTPEEALTSQNPFTIKEVNEVCGQSKLNLLCQAYQAAALNHLPEAEDILTNWLKNPTDPQWVSQTQTKLASTLILQGKLGLGANIYTQMISPKLPESSRKSLQNAATLFGAFKDVPLMQVIAPSGNYPIRWDEVNIPRIMLNSSNNQSVEALIDTGANLSTISKSAAKRLGLKVIEGSVQIHDSGGLFTSSGFAYAPSLSIGDIKLSNIPFLILDDQSMIVKKDKSITLKKDYEMEMILGLPVIMKLGRIELHRDGHMIISKDSSKSETNLFLDHFELAVRTNLENTPIDLMVDTGARSSYLGEGFKALAGKTWDSYNPTSSTHTSGGVGGLVTSKITNLRNVNLKLNQQNLNWKEISFYPNRNVAQGRLHGVIG
ncbi:hypothetical protein EON78_06320, partial [bacterium]